MILNVGLKELMRNIQKISLIFPARKNIKGDKAKRCTVAVKKQTI